MSGPTIPPELVKALREARSVAVLTGSGISAESGVPTFRGAQTGLWERYDPQQLAMPEAFARDPKLVWNWYEWRCESWWGGEAGVVAGGLTRQAWEVQGLQAAL